ncbi:MAG TPA: winged helix-turn-helix transcriptional regulator, partial [Methanocorpusculum sp.]|nr:winged helix-turn-helix transcriptional regulator [Methanocorpusculum sp.]
LNTIREHPGATQSELQKLTGHSRGSVSVNLHHLSMTSKIRKRVQNGKSRYYLACTPDDEMKGFLRKLTTQENPQKILEAIISNPGISQKELHETTEIPKTTLQWHLSQLAKYEAIQSTRERNTVHYSVIPDLVLLYNNALEETKQNNTSAEEKEPDNKES